MGKPGFPNFDVWDEDDAAVILELVESLANYVADIEPWTVLSLGAEETLISALKWGPYAIRQLNAASSRLSNTRKEAMNEIQAALDILHAFEPKIRNIIQTNEEMKKEAEDKEIQEKEREFAVESP
ncbi:hypothetical protein K445DRAFT_20600 [Daldinia sp. EC12]|nr:hypothetical protein F4774DRAFT_396233 [Daldinia eschscholtzii]OTB17251.1 hypothetical protein K445DRAFT_20600 [Daldinia sp. EC12]